MQCDPALSSDEGSLETYSGLQGPTMSRECAIYHACIPLSLLDWVYSGLVVFFCVFQIICTVFYEFLWCWVMVS